MFEIDCVEVVLPAISPAQFHAKLSCMSQIHVCGMPVTSSNTQSTQS